MNVVSYYAHQIDRNVRECVISQHHLTYRIAPAILLQSIYPREARTYFC